MYNGNKWIFMDQLNRRNASLYPAALCHGLCQTSLSLHNCLLGAAKGIADHLRVHPAVWKADAAFGC